MLPGTICVSVIRNPDEPNDFKTLIRGSYIQMHQFKQSCPRWPQDIIELDHFCFSWWISQW